MRKQLRNILAVVQSNQWYLSLHSRYSVDACNELAGPIFTSLCLRAGKRSSSQRNVGTVASCWQRSVRFHQPDIWTSDLSLWRQTRYCSTNWTVARFFAFAILRCFRSKNSKKSSNCGTQADEAFVIKQFHAYGCFNWHRCSQILITNEAENWQKI